jgi:hypothetical protein
MSEITWAGLVRFAGAFLRVLGGTAILAAITIVVYAAVLAIFREG